MVKLLYISIFLLIGVIVTVGFLIIYILFSVHKKIYSKADTGGLSDLSRLELERLSGKTIFFGHQSVGNNIIQGILDIYNHMSVHLNIMETKNSSHIKNPVLAHAKIGQNLNPKSKIEEFKALLESGFGNKTDIALLKLCYADITSDTDTNAIFNYYCEVIDKIKSQFPKINIVHVTVPLLSLPCRIKGIIKLYVKRIAGYSSILTDNIARAQFNDLMRKKYLGKEPLFDLALYESLGQDSMQHFSFWKKQDVPVLVSSYTDDGGHLNKTGRQYVSKQLLKTLLNLTDSK